MANKTPFSAPPKFLPTPEEIAVMCEEFQKDWTETERIKRTGGKQEHRPGIRVIHCEGAAAGFVEEHMTYMERHPGGGQTRDHHPARMK